MTAPKAGVTRSIRGADLFCGAGGASCGMWQAGVELVAGIDADGDALQTHEANLPGEHIQHDLRVVRPDLIPPVRIDWVHGSPPCQGFSQAKGERDPDDSRNQLVWSFIEWIDHIRPKVVTMENVAGMQTISDHFLERVNGAFRDVGYSAKWRKLNTADYGVPQTRKRIYFVAIRDDVPTPSRWFPRPTHAQAETTTIDGRTLDQWRTVREAIGDLAGDIPPEASLTSQQNEAHQKAGRRDFHTVEEPAKTIRCGTPPEVETDGGIVSAADYTRITRGEMDPYSFDAPAPTLRTRTHFVQPPNHVPHDHQDGTRERFATLDWGETGNGISNRRLHPEHPSPTICASPGAAVPPIHYIGKVPNHDPPEHADETRRYMARLEQGESQSSTTERRLHPSLPAPTITSSERSPPVHYQGPVIPEESQMEKEGEQDVRRLTVREAARLQSFDDWFVFKGTKTDQLRQVGNAVPPRLQQHIAAHVERILEGVA